MATSARPSPALDRIEFGVARSSREVRAVQRLRYRVYVEELGRYHAVADHDSGLLAEPEDDTSWLVTARDGDTVVAATRLSWGGAGFSPRQVAQYELGPWLEDLPAELLAVGERSVVDPAYRGSGLVEQLLAAAAPLVDEYGVRAVFGCCEPHLLSLYVSIGQRPYARRNIDSDEAGYLIPLVAFVPDVEALRGVGTAGDPTALAPSVRRVVEGAAPVRTSVGVAPTEHWASIRQIIDGLRAERVLAFDGLTDDEATACTSHSSVIDCAAAERLLKRGGTARNMFVVLTGSLEVRDGDRVVGVLAPGDVFGEMAFLLEGPRHFDVVATTDASVLSLSEGSLRRLISSEPTAAAKLLLNVSKMLCARLIEAEQLTDAAAR